MAVVGLTWAAALGGQAPDKAALSRTLLDNGKRMSERLEAAMSLARLGAVEPLTQTLTSDDVRIRLQAGRALAEVGSAAVPALVKALKDGPLVRRRFAAFALARLGTDASEAAPALVKALADESPEVRRNAAEALGRIGAPESAAALVKALKDEAREVRQCAAKALARLNVEDEAAGAALKRYIEQEKARTDALRRMPPPKPMAERSEQYEIGGPLAGIVLPRFKGQHGEEPGHPGCIPELMAQAAEVRDMGNVYQEWGPQGLVPELELYPGAEEHWRAYWFKYCPVRSMFDRQSQLQNWVAPDIPGASKEQVAEYAAPVYWIPRHSAIRDTGRKRKPVPVIRWQVEKPVCKLDLGTLGESMYALRVIAAVPTENLRTFRRPVFLRMRVNDGLNGEVTEYKRRLGYCDEFYSVCEFYFHAPQKRHYHAELWMDKASEVDLLVRNVSLDDVLAGVTRAPIKRQISGAPSRPSPTLPHYTREERLARDAAIWNYLPPLNHQGSGNSFRQASFNSIFHPDVSFGVEGRDRKQVNEQHGAWTAPRLLDRRRGFQDDYAVWDLFLTHPKLGLQYTLDDMRKYHPLPDPYPLKDDGTGLYYPDPENPNKGKVWAEIAVEVMHRIRHYPQLMRKAADEWRKKGDVDAAHDGAIALARYAYRFPSVESATYLCNASRDPGAYGRNLYNRRRETAAMWLRHYAIYLETPTHYDKLFDYIQGNEELAASIARFVPWVKSSQDVVKLIDMYLVQTTAKRVLRYHYHTHPMVAMELAAILGLNKVTEGWIDWTFSRTFVYPLPPAGIGDLMISGCGRCGAEYIGSTYYAQGEGALRVARSVQKFVDGGLLPERYNLTDMARYPKPLAKCFWQLNTVVAGRDFIRVGDVTGPDKPPGRTLGGLKNVAADGWRWSKDARFAWMLKHMVGRGKGQPDAEWAAIEKAAAAVKRAPWLDLRSRQLYNWVGILETGHEHDDFRFRRAVYVRIGAGIGHHHHDALDLQVVAHGVPMTIDDGQRPAYSTPGARSALVHNSPGAGYANSWVQALADAPQARYLRAKTGSANLCQRQVALIDVDEGQGSGPVTIEQQVSGLGLPKDVVTPNSYVFDVCRLSGGSSHSYNFHGPISDEVANNALDLKSVGPPKEGEEPSVDAAQLAAFKRSPESWLAGNAPDTLEVTWVYARGKTPGNEQRMAGRYYDAGAPLKYTRLHLLGAAGARVYQADAVCQKWNYRYTHTMTQRRAAVGALSTAFVALIEPYVRDPFIVSRKLLDIPENEDDALKAVAVQVETKNGHRDLCFADGRPSKIRRLGSNFEIGGEFAFYSTDKAGFRLATLVGGSRLAGPDVRLELSRPELVGKVISVNYLKKQIIIDTQWPASVAGSIFEIGGPKRTTSYTSRSVEPAANGSVLTVTHGADYLRSTVSGIDEKEGVVTCLAKPSLGTMPGLVHDFTASNDEMTKFWRADYLGSKKWKLTGAPVSEAAFAPSRALRVWEYGVGDQVRLTTFASIRRIGTDVYELTANAGLTLSVKAGSVQLSTDRKTWRAAKAKREGDWSKVTLSSQEVAKGPVYLRARVGE